MHNYSVSYPSDPCKAHMLKIRNVYLITTKWVTSLNYSINHRFPVKNKALMLVRASISIFSYLSKLLLYDWVSHQGY